jgi:hypothetical protein
VEINKGEPTVKKTGKRKVVKAKDNGKANKENHQQVITTTPPTTSKTVIQLCGCQHGDTAVGCGGYGGRYVPVSVTVSALVA